MADSRKALQGNSSTAKQLTEGEQGGKASRLTMAAMHAALQPSLERTLNLAAQGRSFFSGITPGVANELLRMGMSKDTAQLTALANRSFENAGRVPAQQARIAQSGTAGLANALLAAPPQKKPLEVTIGRPAR